MNEYTIKGLTQHDCDYAFWTGWPATISVLEQKEPIKAIITTMQRLDKDSVQLFGTVAERKFEASVYVNPHQARHGTGTLVMVAQ